MSTITHIDADKIRNPLQKFACQVTPDETRRVLWHTQCDTCMRALRRAMELPGLIFMTHGSGYWCDVHQDTHHCTEPGPPA